MCIRDSLKLGQLLLGINGFRYKSACIRLDQHKLQNIDLLVSYPGVVELLQVTVHFLEYVLHGDVDLIHYPVVDIPDHVLDDFELLEQFLAGVEHIVTEDIFLTVNPQVREAFLRAVQYLGQIT